MEQPRDLFHDPKVQAATEDGKADYRDVAFDVFYDDIGSAGATPTRRVITSQGEYRQLFGHDAPGIDFGESWVVFYSGGMQPTSGYEARIRNIKLDGTWLFMKITTQLLAPPAGCAVIQTPARPYVLARFSRHPFALTDTVRFERDDGTGACTTQPPQPGANPTTCAEAMCRSGMFCSMHSGAPTCHLHYTCVSVRPPCGPGTHCRDVPVACTTLPCPPSAPTCHPYACPAPGLISCAPPIPIWRGEQCTGPYHDWIVANCPAVTFAY